MTEPPERTLRQALLMFLCREYHTPGVRGLVASEIGKISKGEIIDFVDYYCGYVTPALTVAEQQQLLTELWNWREEHAPFARGF